MTNPNDPYNSQNPGGHSEGYPGAGDNYNANGSGLPSYGETAGGYGAEQTGAGQYGAEYSADQYGTGQYSANPQTGYHDYGYQEPGGAAFGTGNTDGGVNAPGEPYDPTREVNVTDGPVPVVGAMPFGFKRLFTRQWHVYVGLIFIPMVIALLGLGLLTAIFSENFAELANRLSNLEPGQTLNDIEVPRELILPSAVALIFLVALSFIFNVVLDKVALHDTRGVTPTWGNAFKNVPWGAGFAILVLVALINYAINTIFGLLPNNPLISLLSFLVTIGLMPFLGMIPYYAIDGKTSVTGAFKAAVDDVKPQYFNVLGAMLLLYIVAFFLAIFTLGFGVFIAVPVVLLGKVFIYRWISSEPRTAPEQPTGYMSMY